MKKLFAQRSIFHEFFLMFFLSILLTSYFTFPLITNLGSFHNHDTDFYINGWTYWYTTFSVLTGSFFDVSKFFNAPILYPFPNILAQLDFALIPSVIFYLPVYLFSKNHILSLNYSIFSSFVLNFISCYYSIKFLSKNKLASFLAAIVFSFSPNVIQLVAGHLEYLNRFFVPPFFVLLYEYFTKPSSKKIFLLGIVYSLLWFTNIQMTLFITITAIIAFPIYLIVASIKKRGITINLLNILKYLPVLVIYLPIIIYYFYPYYEYSQKESLTRSKAIAEYYSPKPIDFFLPFPNNKLFGHYSLSQENSRNTRNERHFNYAERTLLPGYLVLISLPFLIYLGIFSNSRRWLFYFLVFLFQLFFSFGPYVTLFNQKISFVYSWIYDLTPLLSSVRTPTRIQYVWLFFIAYFVAFGFTTLTKKLSSLKTTFLFLVIFVILVAEYSTKFSVIETNHIKINKINFDLTNKVVLVLPIKDFGANPHGIRYTVYQPTNQFISLNGSTGSEWEIAGFSQINEVIENFPFSNYWFNVLQVLNVDYVVVDKNKFQVPNNFKNLFVFDNDSWIIIDPKKYKGMYGPNCDNHEYLQPDMNTIVRYDEIANKIYLSFILKNGTKCDIFFKGSGRYKKIEYAYYIDGKLHKSSRYISMPVFMLFDSEFGDTVTLESNVKKTPSNFYLKIDDGDLVEQAIYY